MADQKVLKSIDIDGVADFILSGRCKSIAFLTGAGMSVGAGIFTLCQDLTCRDTRFQVTWRHVRHPQTRTSDSERYRKVRDEIQPNCCR